MGTRRSPRTSIRGTGLARRWTRGEVTLPRRPQARDEWTLRATGDAEEPKGSAIRSPEFLTMFTNGADNAPPSLIHN